MCIKSIEIKNFKTFKNVKLLDLNKNFNFIVGANGSGKTNFYQAMKFILTDKFDFYNIEEYKNLLNDKIEYEEIYVIIEFNNSKSNISLSNYGNSIFIKKAINAEGNLQFFINNVSKSSSYFYQFLEKINVSKLNKFMILFRNNLENLSSSIEDEIFETLKKLTGSDSYDKNKEEVDQYLNEITYENTKSDELLENLKDKISNLENYKGEYDKYNEVRKKIDILKYLIYEYNISKYDVKIQKMDKNLFNQNTKIEKLNKQFIEENEVFLNLKNNIRFINQNIKNLNDLLSTNEDDKIYELENNKEFNYGNEINKLINKKNDLNSNINNVNNEINNYYDINNNKNNENKTLEVKVQMLQTNSNQNHKDQNNNNLENLKWEFKNNNTQLEFQNKELDSINQNIENNNKELKKYDSNINNIKIYINNLKDSQNEDLKEKKQNLLEMTDLRQDINQNENLNLKLKSNLKSVYKNLNISNIFKLKRYIESNNINGIRGLLIDLVNFRNDKLINYFELLFSKKLFFWVVDTYEDSEKLNELALKFNCGRITIINLEFYDNYNNLDPKYPENEKYIILKDNIIAKKDDKILNLLIEDYFGGNILVEDLNSALKISKECNLNCITKSKEIVYSGSFISNLGHIRNKNNFIEAYENFKETEYNLIDKRDYLNKINHNFNKLKDKEIIKVQELQKKTIELNSNMQIYENINSKINNQNFNKYNIESEVLNLNSKINNLEENIKIWNKELKRKNVKNINENQIGKNIIEKNSMIENINKNMNVIIKNKKKLNELEKHRDELIKDLKIYIIEENELNLKKNNQNLNNNTDLDYNYINEINKKIKENMEIKKNQIEITTNQYQQIIETKDNIKKLKKDNEVFYNKKYIMIKAKDEAENKKLSLGFSDLKNEKLYNTFSKYDRNKLITKLNFISKEKIDNDNNRFTDKDKIYFDNIEDFKEKQINYKKDKEYFNECLEFLQKYLDSMDNLIKGINKKLFDKLKESFNKYFNIFNPNGKSDLILKKVEKEFHSKKSKYKVELDCQFDNNSDNQTNIIEKSTGQKGIIVLSLILALNEHYELPFYFLDEIDFGLDDIYAEKLITLLEESKSQIFLTSFRSKFLDINDKKIIHCNFNETQNYTNMFEANAGQIINILNK